jgi:hypothetical protein
MADIPVGWYVLIRTREGGYQVRPAIESEEQARFLMREFFCDALINTRYEVSRVEMERNKATIHYNTIPASYKQWTVGFKGG